MSLTYLLDGSRPRLLQRAMGMLILLLEDHYGSLTNWALLWTRPTWWDWLPPFLGAAWAFVRWTQSFYEGGAGWVQDIDYCLKVYKGIKHLLSWGPLKLLLDDLKALVEDTPVLESEESLSATYLAAKPAGLKYKPALPTLLQNLLD